MTDTYELTPEELESIRGLAYEKFVARGCEDGHDMEDWLSAEEHVRSCKCAEPAQSKPTEIRPTSTKTRGRAVTTS
jgi:hypothetical protein